VSPEHVGARFTEKRVTPYLRRLKSHVLIGLIKGSFNDYHKSGLLGGEGRSVHTYATESTYCVIYLKCAICIITVYNVSTCIC